MLEMIESKLKMQLEFLIEIDKLKTVFRRTSLVANPERFENSAEHSWHLAMYVMVLAEYSREPFDVLHVVKMVLLHDLVEIDAGDTFCYDEEGHQDKNEREQRAAERLFGLLPAAQRDEFMAIWQEFEAGDTPAAKFAATVDRLQPLLHNYLTGGGSWKRHQIKREQVEKRMQSVQNGSLLLADVVKLILEAAEKNKILAS